MSKTTMYIGNIAYSTIYKYLQYCVSNIIRNSRTDYHFTSMHICTKMTITETTKIE